MLKGRTWCLLLVVGDQKTKPKKSIFPDVSCIMNYDNSLSQNCPNVRNSEMYMELSQLIYLSVIIYTNVPNSFQEMCMNYDNFVINLYIS